MLSVTPYIYNTAEWFRTAVREMWRALREALTDQGQLMFLVIVPLFYPLLYSFIYTGEVVREVPVAVVDQSYTAASREFLRRLDATADVEIVARVADLAEAKSLVRSRDVYGVVVVPEPFASDIARGEQTHVEAYVDMSGMLYYKAILASCTNVSLTMNAEIKVARAGGMTRRQEEVTVQPIAYEEVSLFNPQGGFASFLIPAVLILVLQQTLLLGITMGLGTRRDRLPAGRVSLSAPSVVFTAARLVGRASAYFLLYLPVSVYVLGVVPKWFSLPQIGGVGDIAALTVPLLLATIFLAFTLGVAVRQRETGLLLIVFTSVPLLFLSGISWPGSAVAEGWKALGYLFPSTFGINGFVRVNTMGASLPDVSHECRMLWLQTAVYFVTALAATYVVGRKNAISAKKAL